MKQQKPYGTWPSALSSRDASLQSRQLGELKTDSQSLYWLELRPDLDGRTLLYRKASDGAVEQLTPADYSVRSRVHEYGGSAYCLTDDAVLFVNDSDQQIYRQPLARPAQIQAITQAPDSRFADLLPDPHRHRLIAVEELHRADLPEPRNRLVAIDLTDGTITPLAEGADFYASPCLGADGRRLAWLSWNHPYQPWRSTALNCAEISATGDLPHIKIISSGFHQGREESVFQPQFAADGSLLFISDRNGWWNLYRYDQGEVQPLREHAADYGLPQWQFGLSTYQLLDNNRLCFSYLKQGRSYLGLLDPATSAFQEWDSPYTHLRALTAGHGGIYCLAASPTQTITLVFFDNEGTAREIITGEEKILPPEEISQPEHIAFPTGPQAKEEAYGFFYPPCNSRYEGPEQEKPPLVLFTHGGPTGMSYSSYQSKIQFWTQRGFAVLDLNYRGSSGYGRRYRHKLRHNWGLVDVQDSEQAIRYLDQQGLIDARRVAIRGNSAGGYTTLAALTTSDSFKTGASLYGVSDLALLAQHTHKFESRYLDWLIGDPNKVPERYRERSPIHRIEQFNCPVIFFQGSEDQVVPPEQCRRMADALQSKGIPVETHIFEGERHGFRQLQNLQTVFDRELAFYRQYLLPERKSFS